MPTHEITVTLTCDEESFTYEEAVEFVNDHLAIDFDPPGFGVVGKFVRYDDGGAVVEECDVEWTVE